MSLLTTPHLGKKLEDAIKGGGKVIVVGWIASNHCADTRGLERTSRVRFMEKPPDQIDPRDFVIFTRFISHSNTRKIRREARCEPGPHTIGVIRSALKSVVHLIEEDVRVAAESGTKTGQFPKRSGSISPSSLILKGGTSNMSSLSIAASKPTSPATPTNLAPRLVSPPLIPEVTVSLVPTMQPTVPPIEQSQAFQATEQDPVQTFANGFAEAVGYKQDGQMSKYQLAGLLRKHFGENVRANSPQVANLLEPVIKEGNKNAGSYRATPVLIAKMPVVKPAAPPPAVLTAEQKARQLVAREPEIRSELGALESRKALLNEELQKIALAREILKSLDSL